MDEKRRCRQLRGQTLCTNTPTYPWGSGSLPICYDTFGLEKKNEFQMKFNVYICVSLEFTLGKPQGRTLAEPSELEGKNHKSLRFVD